MGAHNHQRTNVATGAGLRTPVSCAGLVRGRHTLAAARSLNLRVRCDVDRGRTVPTGCEGRRWCRCDVFHGARRANDLPIAHPLPHLCNAPPAATAAASQARTCSCACMCAFVCACTLPCACGAAASQACTCSCSCMCAFVCATDLNKAGLRYTKKTPPI